MTINIYNKTQIIGPQKKDNWKYSRPKRFIIPDELFDLFIKHYFSRRSISVSKSVLLAKKDYAIEHENIEDIPDKYFIARLNCAYGIDEIKKLKTANNPVKTAPAINIYNTKFKDAYDIFMQSAEHRLSFTTARSLSSILENKIAPFIGEYIVANIDEKVVKMLYQIWQKNNETKATMYKSIGLFNNALSFFFNKQIRYKVMPKQKKVNLI